VGTWQGKGQRVSFGLTENCANGVFVNHGEIIYAREGHTRTICSVAALQLPGRHNLANALAAVGVAIVCGVPDADIVSVLQSFTGVPHRLERVAVVNGVTYVNDSIATSPDRTLVALRAMDRKCILIAGGYDKNIPYDTLANAIANKVSHLILIGQTAQAIKNVVPKTAKTQIHFAKELSDAVFLAQRLALSNQTVLLSPASASYDQFLNFEARGNLFKELVHQLSHATT